MPDVEFVLNLALFSMLATINTECTCTTVDCACTS